MVGREEFTRFHRLMGRRVVPGSGDYLWVPSGPRGSYVRYPVHLDRPVGPAERASLFARGALVLMYSRPRAGEPEEGDSLLLLADKGFDLHSLGRNDRSEVKRGLRDCEVRRISVGELEPVGHEIILDNRRRTGQSPHPREQFERWCEAVRRTQAIWRIWGAFYEDQLVAYQTVYVLGGVASTEAGYALGDCLRYRPNNALWFTMLKESMADRQVEVFVEGYYPLRVRESIGQFKASVGLRRVSITRELAISPLLRPFVNRLGHRLCVRMSGRSPGSVFWQRAVVAQERLLGLWTPVDPSADQ